MPWCDECSKFWSPSSLPASGACPTCGRTMQAPARVATSDPPDEGAVGGAADEDYKAPWHFKVMVALAVVYLTWRFVQVVTWML